MKEKTHVDDVDRSLYDFRNADTDSYRIEGGLDAAVVEKISQEKNDPTWMHDFRLQALEIYNRTPVPDWARISVA